MDLEVTSQLERWVKELPASRMVYPQSPKDRIKYYLWRAYTPWHPLLRDTATSLGVVRHSVSRQDFLIGKIHPRYSIKEFVNYLLERGYGNHFVAWKDDDQLVSLRYAPNFMYQYHIRVFKDREVRGHYELTPEHSPVKHILEIGLEDRRDELVELLQGWVVEGEKETA